MQLTVIKSDGSKELYLHTKVLGAIAAALGDSGCYESGLAEQLAEAVTTFLIRRYGVSAVSTDEIHSMVEAILSDTGHDEAALLLHEHRITRQMKRDRLEVIRLSPFMNWHSIRVLELTTTEDRCEPWNKSILVRDLENEYKIEHYTARCIAGNVEEKMLRINSRQVTVSLIREFVLNELYLMRQAEKILEQPPEGLGVEEKIATVC